MRLLPILLLLGALLAGLPAPGGAQTADGTTETPALKFERWSAEAALIEKILAEETLVSGEIEGLRASLEAQRAEVSKLIAAPEVELAPLRRELETLGSAPEGPAREAEEVAAERVRLVERIAAAEDRLKLYSQVDARAATLLSRLTELRRTVFTQELLTRGPSVFEAGAIGRAIASIGRVAAAIRAETAERVANNRMDTPFFVRLLLPLGLILAALFLVSKVRRAVLGRLVRSAESDGQEKISVFLGFSITLVRLLMSAIALALISFAIWNSGLLGPQGEVLLSGITRAVMVVIIAYGFGAGFYSPRLPTLRLSSLPDAAAATAHRWLMALAATVGLDLLFVVQGRRLGLSIEGLEFLNTILLIFGGVALWGFASQLVSRQVEVSAEPAVDEEEPVSTSEETGYITLVPSPIAGARLIARVAAVIAPMLALMGYFAAARFLFYPVVLSGAVIGGYVLIFRRVRDIVDRIAAPGLDSEIAQPRRIRLIPVAVGFLLLFVAAPVLALIWGADSTDLANARRIISQGFAVGEVVISPLDFFSFLLVFSIGYVLTRIVEGVLSRSVLPLTGLDAGGAAAVCAGVFYLGITVSALVAISTTGLDLSNLAIVAGALSVGIGFGLQNIVNNFVSGLILLIERPIKAGDWVELASGMGYVKKVNVRSTEIQTFDRASLFVPNSELISGAVTNWTHSDMNGRLIVPIGVAYGTDLKQVETILTEIAGEHTMLLRRPAPYVLLRRFGADAVEFEIRGVLRDVNWILNVTSDINFEIARRFADAGIEIPFAQRDLHLRNAGEVGRSIGDGIRGWSGEAPKTEISRSTASKHQNTGQSEAAGNEPDGDT